MRMIPALTQYAAIRRVRPVLAFLMTDLVICFRTSPIETIALKAMTGAVVVVATQKSTWKVIVPLSSG
jgi:hypothetical protein